MSEADTQIYVSIELRQSRIADEAREEGRRAGAAFSEGFASVNVDAGAAKLLASYEEVAPQISSVIAGAVVAGGAEGAAAVEAMMQSTSSMPISSSPSSGSAGGGGGIGLGGIFSAFMAIRIARAASEYAIKEADLEDAEFKAENMPERTDSQKVRKFKAEQTAEQRLIEENEGPMGYLREVFKHGGAVAGLKGYLQDQNLREAKENIAGINATNAEENEDRKKFSDFSHSLQDRASAGELRGPERERQEAENRYREELQKLRDVYNETGGNTNDLVNAEKALARQRDQSIQQINDANAREMIQRGGAILGSLDRLHNDPDKAARDEYDSASTAKRLALVAKYGAGSPEVAQYDQQAGLGRQELVREQQNKEALANFDTSKEIGDAGARTRESQMRAGGDDFGASMDAEKQAGADRVASLREQAALATKSADSARLYAEALALEAANAAEATEKEQRHNAELAVRHGDSESRRREAELRSQGNTGAASDAEFAYGQQGAMAKLLAGSHTQQQVDDLAAVQKQDTAVRQREQTDQRIRLAVATMHDNADASGDPRLQKKADYEELREGIIRDMDAAKGTSNEKATRESAEARIRKFEHQNIMEAGVHSSGADLWWSMQDKLAKGAGMDAATDRMAKGDLSNLIGGGSLHSNADQVGKDISNMANAFTKSISNKQIVVIKR